MIFQYQNLIKTTSDIKKYLDEVISYQIKYGYEKILNIELLEIIIKLYLDHCKIKMTKKINKRIELIKELNKKYIFLKENNQKKNR